jgi:predicted acetyltransferase
VATISGLWRPVDEPLVHMLEDPRRFVRRTQDTLWVRIMDVPGALEGRRYRSEGRVVFELSDPFCDWNAGRYMLDASPGGATCERTTATADISLSAVELAAVFLGGTRLASLYRAGRVEGDDGAVRRADTLMGWDPAPWCPEVF